MVEQWSQSIHRRHRQSRARGQEAAIVQLPDALVELMKLLWDVMDRISDQGAVQGLESDGKAVQSLPPSQAGEQMRNLGENVIEL